MPRLERAGAALRAASLALAAACGLLWPHGQALAQCATVGVNQTCTNPAGTTVSGGPSGIFDAGTLTLTNFGTVTGTQIGVDVVTANVTNFGAITVEPTASR